MFWKILKAGGFCCSLLLAGPAGAQPFFTEVTDQAFEGKLFIARSTAFGDYDNDGWPDLFLAEDLGRSGIALWHNEGKGRFANVTPAAIPVQVPGAKGGGSIFGDYDNDGDLDLLVPVGIYLTDRAGRNILLRNDQGVFRDVDLEAGLTDILPTDNAIWLDYDRDGYLDLYTGNLGCATPDDPTVRNKLYRNQGDGSFADMTGEARLDVQLKADCGGSNGGMVAGDFDDDGWPDLYVGVYGEANRLFLNDGKGRFRDATTKEIGDVGLALGVAVGDIDNDGDLEIFQAAGGGSNLPYRSLMLLNLGGGQFLDVTEGVGLSPLARHTVTSAGLADIDNDGDLDLLTGRPHSLFLNQGEGTFLDATSQSGIAAASPIISFADYDLDGFLDVAFGSSDETGHSDARLYRNQGNDNHWLRVELVGTRSNRSGIGARLTATAGDLRQMREVLGGRGYEQDELAAHFGLGPRTRVDRLEVRWPSGQVEVLTDIPADQKIRVLEGSNRYHRVEPTRWQQVPPETLVAGTTLHLNLAVQPALFEPGAEITSVTVDLSELGGSEAVPLQTTGDGVYRLEPLSLAIGPNGSRTLSVRIDQTTSLGPYWVQLSRSVAVLPAEDLVVFGDALNEQWQVKAVGEVAFDFGAQGAVFSGQAALGLHTPDGWKVDYLPAEPVERLGYQVLRFAFHPGDTTVPRAGQFMVFINGEQIILLGRRTLATVGINMEVKDWQVVEIPLDSLKKGEPITSLRFQGNLEGTLYLDDIRLVAVSPPPVTVVEEERTTPLPRAFALAQNFPNPFNGDTVIRFALPEGGEVELAVYNLAGQRVVKLVAGMREVGTYTVRWDGRDERGRELASGVYLYRLRAGAEVETRKLALVR